MGRFLPGAISVSISSSLRESKAFPARPTQASQDLMAVVIKVVSSLVLVVIWVILSRAFQFSMPGFAQRGSKLSVSCRGFAAYFEAADEEDHRDHGDGEQADGAEAVHEAEQPRLLLQQIVIVQIRGAQSVGLRIAMRRQVLRRRANGLLQ